MTTEQATTRKLPGVFKAAISVGIAFHFLALGAMALSVSSGPWSVRYLSTPSNSDGPVFASSIAQYTTPYYLRPLMLDNNYHFSSTFTDLPTIYLEVAGQPRNKSGKYPDAKANIWVRNRQRQLVAGLSNDQPFTAPPTEGVPADLATIPEITFYCNPFEAVKHKLGGMKDIRS